MRSAGVFVADIGCEELQKADGRLFPSADDDGRNGLSQGHCSRLMDDDLLTHGNPLSRHLRPDIGVTDGTVGIQGNGPGGKDAVDLGIAVASADVFAADAVMARAMGFEPLALGLLHYGQALGLGVADLERIDVMETPVDEVMQRFKPHEKTPLQMQWQEEGAMRYLGG